MSKFTGGLLSFVVNCILAWIVTVFTLGICFPWAVCIMINWFVKHVEIDGQKLTFDGNGAQLFGNYIKWWLLIIVTFGIYSWWVGIKMSNWVVSHTHHAA